MHNEFVLLQVNIGMSVCAEKGTNAKKLHVTITIICN